MNPLREEITCSGTAKSVGFLFSCFIIFIIILLLFLANSWPFTYGQIRVPGPVPVPGAFTPEECKLLMVKNLKTFADNRLDCPTDDTQLLEPGPEASSADEEPDDCLQVSKSGVASSQQALSSEGSSERPEDCPQEPQPQRPIANAGEDQVAKENQTIQLDGTGSTPKDSLKYSWTKIEGPSSIVLNDPTSAQPSFTFPPSKEFEGIGKELVTFEITVTSKDGKTDTDTVDIKYKRIPIIVIPGVAGTKITQVMDNYDRIEIWPHAVGGLIYNRFGIGHPALIGTSIESDGRTPVNPNSKYEYEIIDSVVHLDFYGGLIKYLEKEKGYKKDKDLFTFPYDWRFDNAQHFGALNLLINEVLDKSKGAQSSESPGSESSDDEDNKVIIIAHSMGGLLSKGYILSKPERANQVKSLITIGTPYWGAVKAYNAIIDGYSFGNPAAVPKAVKFLAQNAPAPYELLPRSPFLIDASTRETVPITDSFENIRYRSVKSDGTESTVVATGMNPTVLDIANQFFSSHGTPQNPVTLPVPHYVIVGVGSCTLNGYYMTDFPIQKNIPFAMDGLKFVGPTGQRTVSLLPVFGDGDGTVPLWSAQVGGPAEIWFVKHILSPTAQSAEHAALPGHKVVQLYIGQILSALNSDTSPPSNSGYGPTNYSPMKEFIADGTVKLPPQCAK